PCTLARAMGADIVIAVDLNADLMQRHMRPMAVEQPAAMPGGSAELVEAQSAAWISRIQHGLRSWMPAGGAAQATLEPEMLRVPSLLDVVMTSVNIMQMRITRSRMAGDPPELVIAPRLAHMGLLDFHRAPEAIQAGYAATQAALPGLQHLGWKAIKHQS
ncbi:MAG: patatin, partial [Comamonas sp.]|nr:patatin [Candidatus Comamonas equi]